MTIAIVKSLQSFHHRCTQHMSNWKQRWNMHMDSQWNLALKSRLPAKNKYIQFRRQPIMKYSMQIEVHKKLTSKPFTSCNPKQLVWLNLSNDSTFTTVKDMFPIDVPVNGWWCFSSLRKSSTAMQIHKKNYKFCQSCCIVVSQFFNVSHLRGSRWMSMRHKLDKKS